jgi:hypothetical protein
LLSLQIQPLRVPLCLPEDPRYQTPQIGVNLYPYRHTGIPTYLYTDTPRYPCTPIPINPYTDTPIYPDTLIPRYPYTDIIHSYDCRPSTSRVYAICHNVVCHLTPHSFMPPSFEYCPMSYVCTSRCHTYFLLIHMPHTPHLIHPAPHAILPCPICHMHMPTTPHLNPIPGILL